MTQRLIAASCATLLLGACMSQPARGIADAPSAATTVKMDFFHKPLPEIPLPNDLATTRDASSGTGLRINASMVAPTQLESHIRELIDGLDGWGTLQPIVVPFTGPLDIQSILDGHRDVDYDPSNDVIYLVNVDPDSRNFGRLEHLDLGNGNYPVVLERLDNYWKNDPRGHTISILYEETNEDLNGNGVLDPGQDTDGDGIIDIPPEDTDADGVLDVPNYLPNAMGLVDPMDPNALAARADALMTFYERETNTLIARPMVPLDERTTYAVIITRRLRDAAGDPVGSPFPFVNHSAQTPALTPLLEVMPAGLDVSEIAFAFTFTTQSAQVYWQAVRDGLYGHGVQAHLGVDFPAQLGTIELVRDDDALVDNPYILHSEIWRTGLEEVLTEIQNDNPDTEEFRALIGNLAYVDYFVIGSYESPQLFAREDADGNWLGLDDQRWPEDLDQVKAPARSETIYFTISVPRKEVSARGSREPAPLLIQGHGYGSNRFEGMQLAGYFAKHGFATLAIDGPSHGLSVSDFDRVIADALLRRQNLERAGKALFMDRGINQDNDPFNTTDSGADFWTSYLFHTRDVVRQFTLDYMQAVRIVRSFDGVRRWAFDLDGNGENELAGDFDADGVIDIGGDAMMTMLGGSLGGIMSMMVGSLEPEITAIAPISGGGGFADMGIRTVQGGAVEGFILGAMNPLFVGTLDLATGDLLLETIVVNLNDSATLHLATVPGVKAWDTMVVENLINGERGCGYVNAAGLVRASVACDLHDSLQILIYAGPVLVTGSTECEVQAGRTLRATITTFEQEVEFQWNEDREPITWAIGSPLVALAEGLALRRAHPDLRRFQGLGQLVLDSADPATFARHLSKEPLEYPGTGQRTGTHAMVITTMGDLSVPASSGMTYGRAAGFIDYTHPDSRYGRPMNQVLLDNYVAEAVHTYKRFTDPSGAGVHIDIENFSGGNDLWGSDIPRLSPPTRIGFNSTDPLGGRSLALFPFPRPDGQHGFDMPGSFTDKARRTCRNECTLPGTNDPCGCDNRQTFDIGFFMLNMIGRYLSSGGMVVSADLCQSRNDCADLAPPPPVRVLP